jgi:hypothetical protein
MVHKIANAPPCERGYAADSPYNGIPVDHPLLVSADEWADVACEELSLEDLRDRLSGIRGSLAEAILKARREP